MEKKNIEFFYDYFDFVCNVLYHNYQKTYLEGMNEAFSLLLDDEIEGDYREEDILLLRAEKDTITEIEFLPEEVRKSVQLGLLKGYKHAYQSNALITPDTIGLFIGYLIKKLYNDTEITSILDPLVGTGNLGYSIINYLERDIKLFGVDNDILKCNLARNIGDLLHIENEIFYQDTVSYFDQGFDCIVTDMPLLTDHDDYLPYKVVNHHLDGLKEGGYFFGIIDNDFFDKSGSDLFKKEIDNKSYIFGLIKLSESLFKGTPKSILIIRKKGEHTKQLKDFLLVDLPSFTDIQNFNVILNQIEDWIDKRKGELE
jgi:site-specific DNA-methyltransferase (adenine-specific)